jgi:hypothetical protein
VDPALEQRAAAGKHLVVAPATPPPPGAFECVDRQVANFPDLLEADDIAQYAGHRLVGIVLRHEYAAPARR